jgi:hypothetical protein
MGSSQTPDSSQMAQRPIGRKRAKEQLKKKGGDDGSYKNVVQELFVKEFEVARGLATLFFTYVASIMFFWRLILDISVEPDLLDTSTCPTNNVFNALQRTLPKTNIIG